VNVKQIVEAVQQGKQMTQAETLQILQDIRSDADRRLHAVMVGVMAHHEANAMAQELAVIIADLEASNQTSAQRASSLEREVEDADLALRQAKAAKIMLPGTASPAEINQADQAIQQAERDLQKARRNLQAGKQVAVKRQRELDDLRAVHRALASVKMPDVTPIRTLIQAAS
jgi:chromosome segregation ATPase